MGQFREVVSSVFGVFVSILIAWLRLCFLTLAMFASGTQLVVFSRTEICNIELRGQPWLCDRAKMEDKMSFIEKTCLQNPDLLDYAEEHPDHTNSEDTDDGEDYGV